MNEVVITQIISAALTMAGFGVMLLRESRAHRWSIEDRAKLSEKLDLNTNLTAEVAKKADIAAVASGQAVKAADQAVATALDTAAASSATAGVLMGKVDIIHGQTNSTLTEVKEELKAVRQETQTEIARLHATVERLLTQLQIPPRVQS